MKKTIISVLLLLSIFVTLFTGCGFTGRRLSQTDMVTQEQSNNGTTKKTEKSTTKATEKTTEETKMTDRKNDETSLKILTIGNSFSDDTMEYMYKIAKSAGINEIKLGNLYIGGCSIDTHVSNAQHEEPVYEYRVNTDDAWNTTYNYRMGDALVSEDWDFVSLQQASGSSGIADTYNQLQYLIGYVQALAPTATLVWNMTWAYQQDSVHEEFSKYGRDQKQMYESILSAVQSRICTNNAFKYIVPNGTAIQNARTSYVGDTLTRDGFHLSLDFGRYIAGLTFFYRITGIPINDIEFAPDGVDDNLKGIAIESAINAVYFPWKVTASVYTEEPELDMSLYDVLDLGIIPLGYWNSMASQTIYTTASNSHQYAASRLLNRDDLPVGSIIVLADGWKYRPEAWKSVDAQPTRPENVTSRRIVISEKWWGDYTSRAFNISKVDGSSLRNLSAEEIAKVLIIYVPKQK